MKNITFKADDALIEKARLKAKQENRSLNDVFNDWLKLYIYPFEHSNNYIGLMENLSYANSGKSFARDEMNER
ncbi:MAG: antitoxin [Spirochaetia bacterium]|nr:antitoxin [Spirochaetia bacterium]